MSSIDERIVEMTFKSASFVSGVSSVIASLTKLKSSLNLSSAEKSLNDLDAEGKRFSLSHISDGVSSIASKFSALGVLGISALATIASKAVSAGLQLVKSFTIDPIKAGLDVYETKINAIKTILANTQSEGTNLKQVTAALDQLNTYANKTVYNFGEMAQNIGTFTAAGVNLKTSVASIKGIANLAALSGSSAQQASTAMYQLSQAIASGSVKLQDWNSVVNAGLGGKVFQNQLEETARATGVNIDAIIKKAGSFRDSLKTGWLTSKILTQTLETFTGDLTNQQLKSLGYSAKQIQQIQATAKAAVSSATQIRTLTQLHSALAEEVATAWSKVWEALIGNIGDATSTLTAVHNVLENAFTKPIYDLGTLLQKWSDLGGRADVIQALTNVFKALEVVMHAIGDAFKDVFPPATASELVNLSKGFEDLTSHLILSKAAAGDVRSIFDGLFSVVKIVVDVIADVAKGFAGIGSSAGSAVGGVGAIVAKIGDFLNNVRQAVESGGKFSSFLTGLGKVLSAPIRLLGLAGEALGNLGAAAEAAWKKIQPFVGEVGSEFSKLGSAIAQAINGGGITNLEHILNQGIFALILLQVKKFIKNLGKGSEEEKPGFIDTIKESFESLTNTLKTMQASLKSDILIKIAAAVGILTASVVALSFINVGKLSSALTAITLMFTELLAGMAIITKISGTAGIVQMTVIAADLNLLATAILILSGAVALLSAFSWEGLGKGIAAVAALLTELVVAVRLMGSDSKNLIAAAYSMEVMATALNILALAVKQLSTIPWEGLAKGVVTIGALLAIIGLFQTFSGGDNLIAESVGMIAIGAALLIITQAIQQLSTIPWEGLAKAVVAMAASMAILAAATILMEASLPGAAALLVASAALVVLSQAMTTLGGMSWDAIAKSLVELAGSLAIIAAAMILMVGALPGAAALIVVAAALAILTPVIIALGSLSWGELLTSLGALAGVLIILAAAGIVMGPVVPVLLGLGAAIALIGVGVLAAGAGVALFSAGLIALSGAVVTVGGAMGIFANQMITLIPNMFTALAKSLVNFVVELGNGATQIGNAFTKLATAMLNAVIKIAPKIGQAIQSILTTILNLINKNSGPIINTMINLVLKLLNAISSRAGQFANAGANAIVNVLNGISRNVGKIATAGGNLAIRFINAIGAQASRIAAAGVNMVIRLVNNVANTIRGDSGRMNAAGRNLASAIIEGIVNGIEGGWGGIESALRSMADRAISAAKGFFQINSPSKRFRDEVGSAIPEGTADGVDENSDMLMDSISDMADNAVSTMKQSLIALNDAVSDNLDVQPTITPVLDLTQAQKGFAALNSLSKNQLLNTNVSANKATSISAENAADASEAGLATTNGTILNFTQNNTSPKALSTADIYRQTKNQLSVTKGALANNANSS